MQRIRWMLPVSLTVLLLIAGLPTGRTVVAHEASPAADVAAQGYQEITITGVDYAFEGIPDTIEAGYTLFSFEDVGREIHHAQLARLNEGVTLEQVEAALFKMEEEPEAIYALATPVGGLGLIAPGGTARIILNLDPGTYGFVCFVPAPDGEPHFAKGMIQTFEVVPAAEETAAEPPEADATLTLKDFTFDGLPEAVEPGIHIWEVVNDGPEPHELLLFQLAPDATAEQFLMALEASLESPAEAEPPPGLPIGGMQAIVPGLSGWLVLDLEPGTYLAVCFIPSPANEGKAHVELGMLGEFTVAEA